MIAAEEALKERLKQLDKNIFVVAGAGAGKSTLMVERLIEQAASGRQLFKHTVAITFTNKAAMELEGKLMEHLLQIDDPVKRERLLAQRNDLTIVTIHAFCQQLLAERPIEAGLNPNFTVIEEPEAEALFTSVLLDYYDSEFAGKNEADAILRADDYGMDVYAPMLYTQAKYRELGLEEACFQAGDLEEAKAAQQEFLATVEAAVMDHAKHVCVGLTFKLLPCLKIPTSDNAGLSLGELIARIYMEADNVEAGLAVLFGKNDLPRIMKVLRDTYSEAELAKEVLVDKEDFTEVVFAYLFDMFAEQIRKLAEKDQLSVESLITVKSLSKKAELEEVLEIDGEWTAELKRLLVESDVEAQLESLFHHLFARMARRRSVRDLFTNTSRQAYDQIKPADYLGFADLLTGTSYNARAYDPALLDILSDYREQRFFYHSMGEQVKAILQDIFQQVMGRYEAAKLDRHVVSQNDLLYKAYQLLENEPVRQYFHQKYRYLYVDECQDTDPLQTKLIFYLTSEHEPKSIEDAKPREGSLFLVGDPKQSIYRFRNADLRIYDQVYQYAKESDDWIVAKLQLNYRSNQELITWFNRQFDPLFAAESREEMQPVYDEMVYYEREKEVDATSGAGVYKLPAEDDELNIADWIETNCKDGNGAYRYEDVMIITPTTKKVINYVKALKARGIPTSFSGKVLAHDFPELVRLTDLVDYVASPNNFKWYKLLAQNWHLPFSLLKEYKDSDETGKEAVRFQSIHFAAAQLDSYREMMSRLRPMEILFQLIYKEQFGIFDPKLSEVDYQSALSILTTFLEKVRLVNPQTLSGLGEQMKRLLEEPIEYEISTDGQTNVVRIMNLHKTKGLEAKIVFLAGPTRPRSKGNYTSILTRNNWEEELAFALYASWPKLDAEKVLYYWPAYLEKFPDELRQDEAERVRRLYVAATRAMDMLIITESRSYETWYDLLSDDLPYLPVAEVGEMVPETKYLAIAPVGSVQDVSYASSYRKVSPSDGTAFTTEAADVVGEASGAALEGGARNAPFKGPLWGSLVHAGIECMVKDRERPVDDAFLDEVIARGLMQYDLNEKELFHLGNVTATGVMRHERLQAVQKHVLLKEALRETLEQVMANDFFRQLLADYDAFSEVPFTAWLEADAALELALREAEEAGDKPVLMTGIIDLVLRSKTNPRELVIIDYKTDRLEAGESVDAFRSRLLTAYQHQLRTYRSVLKMMEETQRDITVYVYAVSLDEFILFG